MGDFIKKLDPRKYPKGETPEQVARRVAQDQVEFGVADGEPDLRSETTSCDLDDTAIDQIWDMARQDADDGAMVERFDADTPERECYGFAFRQYYARANH